MASKPARRAPLDTAGAVDAALAALLAKRDFTAQEARGKLVGRGAEPEMAAAAVAAYEARGYINDARYAERYVAHAARRGLGPRRIAQELRDCGVAAESIAAALAGGTDWAELCEAQRRRRFGAKAPASWAEKGRQARFLQYRGFSSDHMRLATGFDPPEDPDE